jgi:hypothetical protein
MVARTPVQARRLADDRPTHDSRVRLAVFRDLVGEWRGVGQHLRSKAEPAEKSEAAGYLARSASRSNRTPTHGAEAPKW